MMSPRARKLILTVHITVSVGWVGAVLAYLPLDILATTSPDVATLRAAYLGMDWITRGAIVPLALATFATGLVVSLGTAWGLFRHYWVLLSLLLTFFAITILLIETRTIRAFAALASDPATSGESLASLDGTLFHSIGGLVVLLIVLVLNVYKPRGVTPYGWRRQRQERGGRP